MDGNAAALGRETTAGSAADAAATAGYDDRLAFKLSHVVLPHQDFISMV
jgi:hypothetical protein